MVQEHYVLKCVICQTFQSHIVKKSKKWECKICSTKQSLMKVFGQGSGKDCRIHTQKLNSLKGDKEIEAAFQSEEKVEKSSQLKSSVREYRKVSSPKKSKWDDYLDQTEVSDDEESSLDCENIPIRVSSAKKCKLSDSDCTDSSLTSVNTAFPNSYHHFDGVPLNSSLNQHPFKKDNDCKNDIKPTKDNSNSSIKKINDSNEMSGKSLNNDFSLEKCWNLEILQDISSNSNYISSNKSEVFIKSSESSLCYNSYSKSLDEHLPAGKPMTYKPVGSLFEQDCDLSDSEFQLDF